MRTLRLKTNQHSLIANLRYAFNQASMLGELLQNARRAQASAIHITVHQDSLTITDNGVGIADLQTLIFIAESGWDQQLKERENAFGLGVLSTLYFAEKLTVHSRDRLFSSGTAEIIAGKPIKEGAAGFYLKGTCIRLEGVKLVQNSLDLPAWVESELQRLCEAFPVPVWFNDMEIPRPLANPNVKWRETSMGKVLVNLSNTRRQWRSFLQGLPVGKGCTNGQYQVVLLPDSTLAKLPDRQHLLNEMEDHPRIQAAVNKAYRQALIEMKNGLSANDFVTQYADTCLDSLNADLLNDMPFVPLAWFRNWNEEPAGYRQSWRYCLGGNGVIHREALEVSGVWEIVDDDDAAPTAEVYLEAANAYLLEQPRLDDGHWLKCLVKSVSPEQVRIRTGNTVHREASPGLADYEVELELVDALYVGLDGHSRAAEYAVEAIRKENTLYLTSSAEARTGLVSDYVFDDRYEEDREDEDARLINTFIAVGCSTSADKVVEALLPYVLRYDKQLKLAGATVCLVFDDTGKLKMVSV